VRDEVGDVITGDLVDVRHAPIDEPAGQLGGGLDVGLDRARSQVPLPQRPAPRGNQLIDSQSHSRRRPELSAVKRCTRRTDRATVIVEYDRVTSCDRLGALDAAFTAWHDARGVGASMVICATDNATVGAVAGRIRAARVAAGGSSPPGSPPPTARPSAWATTSSRLGMTAALMTSAGAWVRNGDRWRVAARHGDGSITVSHLAGHGRVVLPADYVDQDVSLAYALTVHKAKA
jgi:hypothetical protein